MPLIVENVCGAQRWVGRARAHYGSFYLWGDVPALMPIPLKRGVKVGGLDWNGDPNYKGQAFNTVTITRAIKNSGGSWFRVAHNTTSGKGQNPDGRPLRNRDPMASTKGVKRKFASALIAKIPFELSSYIGRVYKPQSVAA